MAGRRKQETSMGCCIPHILARWQNFECELEDQLRKLNFQIYLIGPLEEGFSPSHIKAIQLGHAIKCTYSSLFVTAKIWEAARIPFGRWMDRQTPSIPQRNMIQRQKEVSYGKEP